MDMTSLPDISSYAAPIYVGFIVLEMFLIAIWHAKGQYEPKDTTTSLLMGTGNLITKLVFGTTAIAGIFSALMWFYQFRLFDISLTWWTVILCLILDDLAYYWVHRLQHEIRWGWASHVIHHSSQHFNLSTALRQPWVSFITGTFVLSIPLVLIGFHPLMIAFVSSINLFYQFFIHTEVVGKLPGWVEAVFNTPSHHRVHHGKNPKYLDANYAGIFIVWDRMFGTFVPEDDQEPVDYGLVKDIGTFNPLRVATHEYVGILKDVTKKGLSWKDRFLYTFARPGWSHDGSRLTSLDIKRAAGVPVKRGAQKDAPALAE